MKMSNLTVSVVRRINFKLSSLITRKWYSKLKKLHRLGNFRRVKSDKLFSQKKRINKRFKMMLKLRRVSF